MLGVEGDSEGALAHKFSLYSSYHDLPAYDPHLTVPSTHSVSRRWSARTFPVLLPILRTPISAIPGLDDGCDGSDFRGSAPAYGSPGSGCWR